MKKALLTIVLGAMFGTILIYSDAFNWYRIQEMFHFESFHMYGLIGSAIFTAGISIQLLKRKKLISIQRTELKTVKKPFRPTANIIGGLFFGVGWALTGACTAPIFILIGYKWEIGLTAISGALIGTIIYALLNTKLPS